MFAKKIRKVTDRPYYYLSRVLSRVLLTPLPLSSLVKSSLRAPQTSKSKIERERERVPAPAPAPAPGARGERGEPATDSTHDSTFVRAQSAKRCRLLRAERDTHVEKNDENKNKKKAFYFLPSALSPQHSSPSPSRDRKYY